MTGQTPYTCLSPRQPLYSLRRRWRSEDSYTFVTYGCLDLRNVLSVSLSYLCLLSLFRPQVHLVSSPFLPSSRLLTTRSRLPHHEIHRRPTPLLSSSGMFSLAPVAEAAPKDKRGLFFRRGAIKARQTDCPDTTTVVVFSTVDCSK